jgi:2-amino-4-hydroxy-6-hydroxymethyldihydropteridine diphosphokinase
MTRCLLGIGANLGDPSQQIASAVAQLAQRRGVHVIAVSGSVTTAAVGGPPGQPKFLNSAVLIETSLSPEQLLSVTGAIERSLGRGPSPRWGARVIDIDILLFGNAVVRLDGLRIPHPWMVTRAFVLQPAAEIAPEFRHPVVGWSIARLWHHLQAAPARFALVGCNQPQTLESLAARLGATWPDARFAPAPHQVPPPEGFATVAGLPEQLKWFKQRAELLRKSGWNQVALVRPQLSPFWLDESLIWARATLDRADRRQFEQAFARTQRALAPPKLVILATGFWPGGERGDVPDRAALRADCQGQLIARDACPFIEVETTEPDDFVREVLGAMQAMQVPPGPMPS